MLVSAVMLKTTVYLREISHSSKNNLMDSRHCEFDDLHLRTKTKTKQTKTYSSFSVVDKLCVLLHKFYGIVKKVKKTAHL